MGAYLKDSNLQNANLANANLQTKCRFRKS
ncbi:pentapeptide repeat-containing protein [Nostoc sp. LEGE 06077]